MSYLQRTGNSRNNISWTNTTSVGTKLLRRTGNARLDISWIQLVAGNTYKLLQRTSTGRNDIKYNNLTISNPVDTWDMSSNINFSSAMTMFDFEVGGKSTNYKYNCLLGGGSYYGTVSYTNAVISFPKKSTNTFNTSRNNDGQGYVDMEFGKLCDEGYLDQYISKFNGKTIKVCMELTNRSGTIIKVGLYFKNAEASVRYYNVGQKRSIRIQNNNNSNLYFFQGEQDLYNFGYTTGATKYAVNVY